MGIRDGVVLPFNECLDLGGLDILLLRILAPSDTLPLMDELSFKMYDWFNEPLNVKLSELLPLPVEVFPSVVVELRNDELEVESVERFIRPKLCVPPMEVSTTSGSNLTDLPGLDGLSASRFSLFSSTLRKFLENFLRSSSLGSFTFSLVLLSYVLIRGLLTSFSGLSEGIVRVNDHKPVNNKMGIII